MDPQTAFLEAEDKLSKKLQGMQFANSKADNKIKYIYNPLIYATNMHTHYVKKYFGPKEFLFLGMNPGPNGMAHNGVPFGDGYYVREWLMIRGDLVKSLLPTQHPKHPILGLDCKKREESGTRFWGYMEEVFGTMENFSRHAYVHNYCPLLFLDEKGRNIVPGKLALNDRKDLEVQCDESLLSCINIMQPKVVVAIGVYAETRVNKVLKNARYEGEIKVVRILHPSPATRKSSATWEKDVYEKLKNILPCMDLYS